MRFAPTDQQQAIYDAVAAGRDHLAIEALAGCGKTTTAIEAARQSPIGDTVGFVAFNKHIATELQDKLGRSARAKTLHALGFGTIKRAFPHAMLEDTKLGRIVDEQAEKITIRDSLGRRGWQVARELARLAKMTLTETTPEGFCDLIDHFGLEEPEDPGLCFDVAARAVEECARQVGTVDFDDMVWLPVKLGLTPDRYDLLFVDEAQDLNRCQQELAWAACQGRMVPIGDRHQAMYGFSGSDPESLPRLKARLSEDIFGCQPLPLTTTWRCPASHVELARVLVPDLDAAPSAVDGEIVTGLSCSEQLIEQLQPGDLVIARRNAPLVDLTFRLVAQGQRARMRGRDIGSSILRLLARLDATDLSDLIRRLDEFREREAMSLMRRKASPSAFQSLHDRCDCLSMMATQARDMPTLERIISQIFDDTQDPRWKHCIVMSSVHRAKGLEADHVAILEPEKMPLAFDDMQPWELQQERNILYVALTRSKSVLTFAGPVPAILKSALTVSV